MTPPAKVEANRRNAKSSTGPKTAAGKAAVSRNAVRHGVFAHLPVIPGENPYDWDRHRDGVVASLAPVGLLERTLAERAALLLWRLARLARFEAGTTAAAVEDAGLLPSEADWLPLAFRGPASDEHLKVTDQNLRLARLNHAELSVAADLLRTLGGPNEPAAYPADRVLELLRWAYSDTSDYAFRRREPVYPNDAGFPAAIGLAGTDVKDIVWTAELLGRALDYYAEVSNAEPAAFRMYLQGSVDRRVAALAREVRRLEADLAAIVRQSESDRARAADAALLPPEQVAERVMKYEKHLYAQLTSTLHELERLQARRAGRRSWPTSNRR